EQEASKLALALQENSQFWVIMCIVGGTVATMLVQPGFSSSSSASEIHKGSESGYEAALEDSDSCGPSALPSSSSMMDDNDGETTEEATEETNGRRILTDLMCLGDKDLKDFIVGYKTVLTFLSDQNNWFAIEHELEQRNIKTVMTFYDIVLDFIIMDAFRDLDPPPGSVMAVIQNRFLSNGFTETDQPSGSRHFNAQSKNPKKLLKRPIEVFKVPVVPKRAKIEEVADPRLNRDMEIEEIEDLVELMDIDEDPLIGPTVTEVILEPEEIPDWEDVCELEELKSVASSSSSCSSPGDDHADWIAGFEACLRAIEEKKSGVRKATSTPLRGPAGVEREINLVEFQEGFEAALTEEQINPFTVPPAALDQPGGSKQNNKAKEVDWKAGYQAALMATDTFGPSGDQPSGSRHFNAQSKNPKKLLKRPIEVFKVPVVPKRAKIEEVADPRLNRDMEIEEIEDLVELMDIDEDPLIGPTVTEVILEPEEIPDWEDVCELEELKSVASSSSSCSSPGDDHADWIAGFEACLRAIEEKKSGVRKATSTPLRGPAGVEREINLVEFQEGFEAALTEEQINPFTVPPAALDQPGGSKQNNKAKEVDWKAGYQAALMATDTFGPSGLYKYFNEVYVFSLETYQWTKLKVQGMGPTARSGGH
ncbi:unnamed protein product, partial [Diamesa serratosioi]